MKKLLFLLAAYPVLACFPPPKLSDGLSHLLALSDVVKVLGEQAHLADSVTKRQDGALRYQCSYQADDEDTKSKKLGNMYFLVEEFGEIAGAEKKYSTIKKANEHNAGVKVIDDLGDEAYFHSDGLNFYFVMVRKGNRIFNIKVNKITSRTSLEEFNRLTKNITAAL